MTMQTPASPTPIDQDELLAKVQAMYRAVAERPEQTFHFETGRDLAERLGYPPSHLDSVPDGAVESFAGVGYFFDLARLQSGESVLDLGSGSGMDAFVAALQVGRRGRVAGIDVTEQQLEKAQRLRSAHGLHQVNFHHGRIEGLPFAEASFDAVISNGVINLAPDKARVFDEAARVLGPGGRLAIADIVTQVELTEAIGCDVELWASCIGGAPQRDTYLSTMAETGLHVEQVKTNQYAFLSKQARSAGERFGVRSISVLARKDG